MGSVQQTSKFDIYKQVTVLTPSPLWRGPSAKQEMEGQQGHPWGLHMHLCVCVLW